MKIVFVSNYFNHHQKPFCEEMHKILGADFVFIATSAMRDERKKLGYTQGKLPNYVLISYQNDQCRQEAITLINAADVVIAGSAPNSLFYERILSGKLLFRYTERLYKTSPSWIKRIYHYLHFRQRDFFSKNIHLLCAGSFAASDYSSIGMYKNRMYKWGYFPEAKKYDISVLASHKQCNTLLWCGRFIDWKHPDDAVKVAAKLKENGYTFRLIMIGSGEMEETIKEMIHTLRLEDTVSLLGPMSPEHVRKFMETAGIYLFTSDRQEGWGAVLNEAMNSGCAVVANSAIGSVSFLIDDENNGMLYPPTRIDLLYDKVQYLLDHPHEQMILGKQAYQTIISEWNAHTAATRLIQLFSSFFPSHSKPVVFHSGPCSLAVTNSNKKEMP